MKISSDYSDLLRCLNEAGVEYLIVGGYAVMIHSEPRFTKDLDIWVNPTPENAAKLWSALRAFGAPLRGVAPQDFTEPEVFYQLGIEPVRADVMTAVPGLTFTEAWINRIEIDFGGVIAGVLNLTDLVTAKKASGRPQDRRDLRLLLKRDRSK